MSNTARTFDEYPIMAGDVIWVEFDDGWDWFQVENVSACFFHIYDHYIDEHCVIEHKKAYKYPPKDYKVREVLV